MITFRTFLGWSLLLSFALLAPISLPAGGASQVKDEIRRLEGRCKIFAEKNCFLRASPCLNSPCLNFINAGTPIRVLRVWNDSNGSKWMHIHILSTSSGHEIGSVKRGWVNV